MPKYNLALLCDNVKHSNALCNLSQQLTKIAPSQYILGENSYPHVTVAQFTAEPKDLSAIWERVSQHNINVSLQVKRYYWSPHRNDTKRAYTGLVVTTPQSLENLQKVCTSLAPHPPLTGVHKDFFGHFTLGLNDISQTPNILKVLTAHPDLWDLDIPLTLALGQSGLDGQFEKILFNT